jgi:hypothetical protein
MDATALAGRSAKPLNPAERTLDRIRVSRGDLGYVGHLASSGSTSRLVGARVSASPQTSASMTTLAWVAGTSRQGVAAVGRWG